MSEEEENSQLDAEELVSICSDLRRSLSRLSFVGMGQSKGLDKELAKLRTIIKDEDENKKIGKSIDKISKIIRTLDDNEDEQANGDNNQFDILSTFLNKELPSPLKKALKQVKKKSSADDANAIIRSIADVIQNYVSQVEANMDETGLSSQKENKQGFFASLFSKKKQTTDIETDEFKDKELDIRPQS